MSRNTTRRGAVAAGAAVCLVVAMGLAANPALAVHDDGLFELDGNAVDDGTVGEFGGDDWSGIYSTIQGGDDDCSSMAGDIAACSFATDAANASIFTTGGSKDEQEVQTSWRHTNGSVPDKDNLLNAYAAQYDNGNLYFGADRYATNGDAQIGFWFFHNEISLNDNGTFSGLHTPHAANGPGVEDDTNGDILILSNFTNGGTKPNIRVFEWYGVNDVRQLNLDSALCATTLEDDAACAITSSGGQTSPWPFVPKSGPSGQFGNGAFYEGGIDLAALGFGGDCFSTFLAETRSSTSITATLKDFVLGQLGECGVTVTTQASSATVDMEADGSVDVSDTATIEGTGAVAAPNPTGTVDFHLCGPSTTALTSCDATPENLEVADVDLAAGGSTNPESAESGAVAVTSAGFYCWTAVYSGDSNYDPAQDDGTNECFEVKPVQPDLTTTATAGPVDLGQPISDVAHLTGTAKDPEGNDAGGTITFRVYGPDSAACAEADLVKTLGPIDVTGDGDYPSGDFTPLVPGEYKWIATYTGDAPNTLGDAGACGDAGESSTVNQDQPTMSTTQSWIPQDEVTIVAPAGGALKGTVDFTLFTGSDCTGTLVYEELGVMVDGATPQEIETSNTGDPATGGYTATATEDYSWQVEYFSDNPAQKSIPATCVEVSSLTIDNDNSAP